MLSGEVTQMQVTARVFRSNYAFHLTAECLTLFLFSGVCFVRYRFAVAKL